MAMAGSQGRISAKLLVLAVFLFCKCAFAAEHIVGGSDAWTIMDYSSWESGETFKVGDTLKFIFDSTAHDVAEVSSSGYSGCSFSGTANTSSPTIYTLGEAKTYYYICTKAGHCSGGMKLKVTVSGSSSTPASPPPPGSTTSASPPPPPSTTSAEHIVGGSSEWTIMDYSSWVSGETFKVGDTLKFIYSAAHDVAEVSSSGYSGCSFSGTANSSSPTIYTLGEAKTYYYICTKAGHCSSGMKLKVTVSGSSSTPASPPPPGSTTSASPPPPPSTTWAEHIVGGSSEWTIMDYSSWVSGETFKVGDTLKFIYSTAHDVAEVSSSGYSGCSFSGTANSSSPTIYTLGEAKTYYYICTKPGHCSGGMRLKVTVSGSSSTPASPPPPGSTTSASPPPPPSTTSASPPPSTTSASPPPSTSSASASRAFFAAPIVALFAFFF